MFSLPELPTRNHVLTFISQSASYGNLGAFVGAGFSKAVLNVGVNEIALSWGELLEQASKKMDVDYAAISKIGVGYPDIASAICKAHSEADVGDHYKNSLSLLKRHIGELTAWYPDKKTKRTFCRIASMSLSLMDNYNQLRFGN